jgi:hypothetical protein
MALKRRPPKRKPMPGYAGSTKAKDISDTGQSKPKTLRECGAGYSLV